MLKPASMALGDASVRQSHVVLIKKETCAPCCIWPVQFMCRQTVCSGAECSDASECSAVLTSNVYTVQRSTKCKIVTWGMGRRAQTSEVVADGAGRGRRPALPASGWWVLARREGGRCASGTGAGAKRTFRCSRGGHWLRKRPRGSPGWFKQLAGGMTAQQQAGTTRKHQEFSRRCRSKLIARW